MSATFYRDLEHNAKPAPANNVRNRLIGPDKKVGMVVSSDVVDGADMRMCQRRDGARFPIEALPGGWVAP